MSIRDSTINERDDRAVSFLVLLKSRSRKLARHLDFKKVKTSLIACKL